ncbi:hypothetical protein GX51_02059 [Blastomyces parvus]|uniref:Uncharacterized protein n=1 Tax=Blastomyces parvus TaxID=2060905 RepID=A0A2B7XDM5_9EURO|nr:hypothetical protein GX51_02059 [Blastomyces parvus]
MEYSDCTGNTQLLLSGYVRPSSSAFSACVLDILKAPVSPSKLADGSIVLLSAEQVIEFDTSRAGQNPSPVLDKTPALDSIEAKRSQNVKLRPAPPADGVAGYLSDFTGLPTLQAINVGPRKSLDAALPLPLLDS